MKVKFLKNFKTNTTGFSHEIQRVKFDGGYVAENMENFLSYLNPLRAIVLATPMASGKNTFVEKLYCENPATQKMRLLYVSNRCILDREIKRRISNKLGLYPHIDTMGLSDIDVFGNITVMTYQSLVRRLHDLNWCKQFDMAVFDECHFLCADATFNKDCGYLLRKIPQLFMTAIRIYMTATVDVVLPYIVDVECNKYAKLRWIKRHLPNSEYTKNILENCWDNDLVRKLILDEAVYTREYPVPLVFEQAADFSYVNLKFLFDEADLIKTIKSSKCKNLVFVDNKEYGEDLARKIDADYVDADSKYKISTDNDVLNKIIDTQKLERNLVSTSVICNGINIKDPDLKNIFIRCDDKSTLIQMLGRKRVKNGEKVNVFVIVPNKATVLYRLNNAKRILSYVNLSKENGKEFMKMLISNSEMYTAVKALIHVCDDMCYFDWMTVEMFRRNCYNYEKICEMLDGGNCELYCKFVCSWLNITFDPQMIIRDDATRTEFFVWLESCVNQELDDKKLTEFSKKFHDYAKDVYKDTYKGRDDRIYKRNALNGFFEKIGLDYYFEFKDSKSILMHIVREQEEESN